MTRNDTPGAEERERENTGHATESACMVVCMLGAIWNYTRGILRDNVTAQALPTLMYVVHRPYQNI